MSVDKTIRCPIIIPFLKSLPDRSCKRPFTAVKCLWPWLQGSHTDRHRRLNTEGHLLQRQLQAGALCCRPQDCSHLVIKETHNINNWWGRDHTNIFVFELTVLWGSLSEEDFRRWIRLPIWFSIGQIREVSLYCWPPVWLVFISMFCN
jgi:hypothetical protein